MTAKGNVEFREEIQKIALLNAVKHDGKAQAGAVIGKILGERSELRPKVKEISALINEVVADTGTTDDAVTGLAEGLKGDEVEG